MQPFKKKTYNSIHSHRFYSILGDNGGPLEGVTWELFPNCGGPISLISGILDFGELLILKHIRILTAYLHDCSKRMVHFRYSIKIYAYKDLSTRMLIPTL